MGCGRNKVENRWSETNDRTRIRWQLYHCVTGEGFSILRAHFKEAKKKQNNYFATAVAAKRDTTHKKTQKRRRASLKMSRKLQESAPWSWRERSRCACPVSCGQSALAYRKTSPSRTPQCCALRFLWLRTELHPLHTMVTCYEHEVTLITTEISFWALSRFPASLVTAYVADWVMTGIPQGVGLGRAEQ